MEKKQYRTLKHSGYKSGNEGYKVIQVNVSNPIESSYAICTPVKRK